MRRVHMCVQVQMCTCVDRRSSGSSLWYLSLYVLDLALINELKVVGQTVPGIHLPLPLSVCCWNCKLKSSCSTFCMGSGDSTQVFTLAVQVSLYLSAIFPALRRMIILQAHSTFWNHLFVKHLLSDLQGYVNITKETVSRYKELLALCEGLIHISIFNASQIMND